MLCCSIRVSSSHWKTDATRIINERRRWIRSCYYYQGCELLDKLLNEERYQIYPPTEALLLQALPLYRDRSDKDWGLTDCASFVLMKQEGISEALTADVHFRQAGFTALLLETP